MLIRSQIEKNKEMFIHEAKQAAGFMHLLMKERNASGRWTRAEKEDLKKYVRRLIVYVPVFCVFLLPGGFFLIPLLAEAMDRRKRPRGVPDRQDEAQVPAQGLG
jgi:hypothetical protein